MWARARKEWWARVNIDLLGGSELMAPKRNLRGGAERNFCGGAAKKLVAYCNVVGVWGTMHEKKRIKDIFAVRIQGGQGPKRKS